MRRTIYHSIIASLLAALLLACGGGDTYTTSGIGGTGSPVAGVNVETTGTITGFGSIFVNGVEFETTTAQVAVDGETTADSSLKLGMVVSLSATINDDTTTGAAATVAMEHAIQGPVADNVLLDPDNLRKTFSVFDITVVAERYSTVFHPFANTSAFSFDQLKKNDVVSISGFFDDNGYLVATSIEEKAPLIYGVSRAIIRGVVSSFNGSDRFNLGTTAAQLTATTELAELGDTGLADGRIVKVFGILLDPATIVAARVKPHPSDAGLASLTSSGDNLTAATQESWPATLLSIEGIVTTLDPNRRTFNLGSQLVDYSSINPTELPCNLSGGLRVEVQGAPTGSILQAASIRPRSGEIEVAGLVFNIDPASSTLELEVLPGQFVTVHTDLRTMIKDEEQTDDSTLGLGAITCGDFLLIKARLDGAGLTASTVKRHLLEPNVVYAVRGPVSRFNQATGELTVLGINFRTGLDTSYQLNDTVLADAAQFYEGLQLNDLVSVRDIRNTASTLFGDGIADEVEIER